MFSPNNDVLYHLAGAFTFRLRDGKVQALDIYDWHPETKANISWRHSQLPFLLGKFLAKISPRYFEKQLDARDLCLDIMINDELWFDLGGRTFISIIECPIPKRAHYKEVQYV